MDQYKYHYLSNSVIDNMVKIAELSYGNNSILSLEMSEVNLKLADSKDRYYSQLELNTILDFIAYKFDKYKCIRNSIPNGLFIKSDELTRIIRDISKLLKDDIIGILCDTNQDNKYLRIFFSGNVNIKDQYKMYNSLNRK